jgi:predicted enzyme related to lactoylglutathione lyase
MKAIEIAFICYAVTDLQKSRNFYERVLDLKPTSVFEKDAMGFIEYDIGSSTLAIGAGADQYKPSTTGAIAALEMENFEIAIQELKDRKVKFAMQAADTGACHMAMIEDPDGNKIMIHKRKPK